MDAATGDNDAFSSCFPITRRDAVQQWDVFVLNVGEYSTTAEIDDEKDKTELLLFEDETEEPTYARHLHQQDIYTCSLEVLSTDTAVDE